MKKSFFIFATMIVSVFSPTLIYAQSTGDLYVELTGDDTGGNTCIQQNDPCRTLEYAVSQSVDGSTIHMGAGEFQENPFTILNDVTITGQGSQATTVRISPYFGSDPWEKISIGDETTADRAEVVMNEIQIKSLHLFLQEGQLTLANDLIVDVTMRNSSELLTIQNSEITGKGYIRNGMFHNGNIPLITHTFAGRIVISDTYVHEFYDDTYDFAAIANDDTYASLLIENSYFSYNNPRVIRNFGIADINSSIFEYNFGRIFTNDGSYSHGYPPPNLTISNSLMKDNGVTQFGPSFESSIYNNNATMLIRESAISNNITRNHGGAIFNSYDSQTGFHSALLTIENSTLEGNESESNGGAIANTGILIINNSTLAGNKTKFNGGAIYTYNESGEQNPESSVYLNQVTFSGNNSTKGAGVVIHAQDGSIVYIRNNTIAFNKYTGMPIIGSNYGYALSAEGASQIFVKNSIVGDNVKQQFGDPPSRMDQCTAGVISEGYNLFGDGTCNPLGATDTIDPGPYTLYLKQLLHNGGWTKTHELIGGPAVDGGDPTDCIDMTPTSSNRLQVDQRGSPFRRHINSLNNTPGRCDIGAFEAQQIEQPKD